MTALATDVHQHLWTEALVDALARRRGEPCVRRDGGGWRVRLAGEPDSAFGPATHDARQRARSARAAGLDRVLICSPMPLGLAPPEELDGIAPDALLRANVARPVTGSSA